MKNNSDIYDEHDNTNYLPDQRRSPSNEYIPE